MPAAAASVSDVQDVAITNNDQLIQSIYYSSVASVVNQCEGKHSNEEHNI